MSKIDWDKPIEVYHPDRPSDPPEHAEVVATGLRGGGYRVGVRWVTASSDLLVRVADDGRVAGSVWRVRNVPTQVTKYILLLKDPKGENPDAAKIIALYSSYEKAAADCPASHKVVTVTYEI